MKCKQSEPQGNKTRSVRSKVKGENHVKMHFNQHNVQKYFAIEHSFYHVEPQNQPLGQKVSITFQVKGQGFRANEHKPFSYKLLGVISSC